ncbi:hypothetical protein [Nitrosopumilus sp. S6]
MATSLDVDIREFDDALKTTDLLVDESVQVYELENEKTNVVDELYNTLKTITEFLGFSVNLPTNILKYDSDTKITLTPSLDVIIKHPNGKEEETRFDELTIPQISQILQHAITPLIDLINKEKIIQNKNITFIRTVTKKLSKIQNINYDESVKTIEDNTNENKEEL